MSMKDEWEGTDPWPLKPGSASHEVTADKLSLKSTLGDFCAMAGSLKRFGLPQTVLNKLIEETFDD